MERRAQIKCKGGRREEEKARGKKGEGHRKRKVSAGEVEQEGKGKDGPGWSIEWVDRLETEYHCQV